MGLFGLTDHLVFSLSPDGLTEQNQNITRRVSSGSQQSSEQTSIAYQSLFLEKWCISVVNEHGSDAEEEQLTETVEEREKMSVTNAVPLAVSYALHGLVQPDTDV